MSKPEDIFHNLFENEIEVYTNHDYEPYAKTRQELNRLFKRKKTLLLNRKQEDQVIFEKKLK
jgi:hypothetical protein